jgi:hypothetical protein
MRQFNTAREALGDLPSRDRDFCQNWAWGVVVGSADGIEDCIESLLNGCILGSS